jgi:lipid-binding SYLF domain-containing protein
MSKLIPAAFVLAACAFVATGCATAPKTEAKRDALRSEAEATVKSMVARDPGIQAAIEQAAGYAVFPSIGQGGLIVGGAYGRGVLYEGGRMTGYVELNQGSVGAQLGGQTFAELILFETPDAVARLRAGNFDLGAEAQAVALNAGAGAATRFEDGVAVFVMPKGGLMAGVSVNGQKLNYQSTAAASAAESSSSATTTTTAPPAATTTRPSDATPMQPMQ